MIDFEFSKNVFCFTLKQASIFNGIMPPMLMALNLFECTSRKL